MKTMKMITITMMMMKMIDYYEEADNDADDNKLKCEHQKQCWPQFEKA